MDSQPASAPEPAPKSQPVAASLTRAAIFLVATIHPGDQSLAKVRAFCGNLSALLRSVGFRDLDAALSCIVSFGSGAWDRLFSSPRPAELHPFREIGSGTRQAPSTPGDMLFHIRSKRMDMCFEMATQIMFALEGAITVVDEVHGFRYFDDRDLLGFVDGTENPSGDDATAAVFIRDEDSAFTGGSYVIIQKYLHNLDGWNALPTETQENIIGRKKLSDIELDDSVKPSFAHNALNQIFENGQQIQILRDNMPFGRPGHGEYGTYYIAYARSPRPIEQMLDNMFIGKPPGNYDRILDFSTAVTGCLFFVPTASFLDGLAGPPDTAAADAAPATSSAAPSSTTSSPGDGSLGIGSLKGEDSHE